MKQTIAVALSGGVDSLMAAYLLKKQGQRVIGIHFITGFEIASNFTRRAGTKISHPILGIGKQLAIPVEIVDIRSEFQEKIVGYFSRTYQSGQTPNPCMYCNPTIKFGSLLAQALNILVTYAAIFLATVGDGPERRAVRRLAASARAVRRRPPLG